MPYKIMEDTREKIMDTLEEVDEEKGISVLDTQKNAVSNETKESTITAVIFGGSDVTSPAKLEGRKINRKDVQQIFQGSTTTAPVSNEQIHRIKMMHDKISDGVDMDFNYMCLLTVASIIAGLGLSLGSSTTVISSMLLSPIMGPVIGMSYGLIIWDVPLIKRSARNELLSIFIGVVFGVLIGLCCFWTEMAESWPTSEMYSRGTRVNFLAGIPIAFFSGIGVALSVLDDQTKSLVGVAISTSLLTPAVNCGLLFIVAAMEGNDWTNLNFEYDQVEQIVGDQLDELPNFSQLGVTSLMLTIANVIMVALGATLMFRAKEVLPVKKKVFWDDLKTARRVYTGRAIHSVTGEALDIQSVKRQYAEQSENSHSCQ